MNCTSGMVVATAMNFSFALTGQRIATVKSAPFAVKKPDLEGLIQMLQARGPLLQARPATDASVAVVYCDPISGDRARTLFEPVRGKKLERLRHPDSRQRRCARKRRGMSSRAMQQLLRSKPVRSIGSVDHRSG